MDHQNESHQDDQKHDQEHHPTEHNPEEHKTAENHETTDPTHHATIETHTEPQTHDQTHAPADTSAQDGTHENKGMESSWQNLNTSVRPHQEPHKGTEADNPHTGESHSLPEGYPKPEEHKANVEASHEGGVSTEHQKPKEVYEVCTPDMMNLSHTENSSEKPQPSESTQKTGGASPSKVTSTEDRYEKAVDLKNNGNNLTKEKKYEEAIALYKSASMLINPNTFPTPAEGELKDKINDLRLVLWNNLSHCYLNLEMVDLALEHAEKVERLEPDNTKALYRIAVCLEKQGKDLEALEKIKTIYKISKRKDLKISNEVTEAYQRLQAKTKQETEKLASQEKQEKELYQKMLGKKPDDTNPKQSDGTKTLLKGLLVVPSVGIAYLLLTKGLKSNLKNQNSKLALGFLSASIFGTLVSGKVWLKGVFATSFLLFTGLAQRFKTSL